MALVAVTTKAELARELGYSRARLTQLAKEGMPVRPDGKLNRAEALEWIKRHTNSYGGGWHLRGKGGGGLPRLAANVLNDPSQAFLGGQQALYAELRERCLELPVILLKLGAPVPIAAASSEIFDFVLGEWVLAYGEELIEDDEPALPDPDYAQLAKVAGVPVNAAEWEIQRCELIDRVVELFAKAKSAKTDQIQKRIPT